MMKIQYVEPQARLIGTSDPIDRIAECAHTCYKARLRGHEDNLAFVSRLIKARHLAAVEHASIHVLLRSADCADICASAIAVPSLRIDSLPEGWLVSFNLHGLIDLLEREGEEVESPLYPVAETLLYCAGKEIQSLVSPKDPVLARDILDGDFVNVCEGESVDEERIGRIAPPEVADRHIFRTVELLTDRGVTHELVRHRLCSFAQESTRYCNYSKDKFGNSLRIVKPLDYDSRKAVYDSLFAETARSYAVLLAAGARPEEARAVLPNALASTLVISAYMDEWKHIFEQRLAPSAHPECRRVVSLAKEAIWTTI